MVLALQVQNTTEEIKIYVFNRVDNSDFRTLSSNRKSLGPYLKPTLTLHSRITHESSSEIKANMLKPLFDGRGFGLLTANSQLYIFTDQNLKGVFAGSRIADFDYTPLDGVDLQPQTSTKKWYEEYQVVTISSSGFVEHASGGTSRMILNSRN